MGKCFDFFKSNSRNQFLREFYGNQSGEFVRGYSLLGPKGCKETSGRRGLANFPPRTSSATGEGIGHLHDGVVLLLRPQDFSFFLSY